MKTKKSKVALDQLPGAEHEELKRKALEVTFSQIDKQYGSGAVMMLG